MLKPDIKKFIKEHPKLSYKEGAKKLGISYDAYRKHFRRLGLITPRSEKDWADETKTKKHFIRFLQKARTENEIKTTFQDLSLLKENFEGYTLFSQRDLYHQLRYILLPKISDQIVIQPRKWDFHTGQDEKGKEQPYLLAQLPEFHGKLYIALLFDVHYGNFAHRKEKFMSYVNWIKNNPNVYAILGGDLLEMALDDGRGMSYDQVKNPHSQLNDIVKILAPIAHKILVATTGNHEARVEKKTGIDVMRIIADKLDIPYFSGPVLLSVMANTFKWNFYVWHGFGNSQTKGGKMNMANRPKGWTNNIHFYVSGHVHDRVCESEACIVEDPINCRLIYMPQWTVVAPAFLSWENTYAYKAGYKPPTPGGISIELFDDGRYKASLTD